MNEPELTTLDNRLRQAARSLPYPPTPDLAGRARAMAGKPPTPRRKWSMLSPARLAWALLVLALAVVLLNQSARAALLDFIAIGVVRIFQTVETPEAQRNTPGAGEGSTGGGEGSTRRSTPTGAAGAAQDTPPVTPAPSPVGLVSLLDLQGETSLEAARRQVDFPIRLPADFGKPDHVFVQDMGSPMVVLVWMDEENPAQAALSLHLLAPGGYGVDKVRPVTVEETTIHGRPAIWASGPYLLRLHGDELDIRRIVDGGVLIWVEDGITYRLESGMGMEEAIGVAEGLVVR